MRIGLVSADRGIPLDGTKGASIHLRSMAEALAQRGHDVTVYASGRASGVALPVRPVEALLLDGRAADGFDLIYERYSLGHEEGLRAARLLDVPFALEVNAPLVLEAGRHRPHTVRPHHHRAEARLFRDADLVFAVSEPLRRHIERLRGRDEGTMVLRNGFDPEHHPVPAPLGPGDVVGFLGHPKPWHGADRLPALLVALRRRGRPARLLVVGGGPGAEALRADADRFGVADAIEVTGALPPAEAARRLGEAAVTVAPYPPDPFFYFCPLKVIESMAAGIPVVAPAQGDIPQIVVDAGILVPPGDDRALADAVDRLLVDASLRSRLGAGARRRAFAGFTWGHVADRAIEAVDALRTERVA
ncbi:MAG TPA: glycosyltransferase [Actinomycetota bacterium]|nr:glycosyltransferase [Actinomycetota bacterium]